MALSAAMTGSGTIGDIVPGWSVNEYATPVAIGERAGGTGLVSFTAGATNESVLVLNNNIVSSHEALGTVPGIVRTVSESGIGVSITHDTVLAKFNADRFIPPLIQGSGWAAVDLATQVIGEVRLNLGP